MRWKVVRSFRVAGRTVHDTRLGAGFGFAMFGLFAMLSVRTRRGKALLMALMLVSASAFISCGSNGSSGSVVQSNLQGEMCDSTEGEVCFHVEGLSGNAEYTWMVYATDGDGLQSESEKRHFTTSH